MAEATRERRSARKRQNSRSPPVASAHIQSTFNNTMITITSQEGNTFAWASAGTVGYKGSRKGTPFAAQQAAQQVGQAAVDGGMLEIDIRMRGPGSGRDAAVRALRAVGLNITSIADITPLPHNGCRPPARRRN